MKLISSNHININHTLKNIDFHDHNSHTIHFHEPATMQIAVPTDRMISVYHFSLQVLCEVETAMLNLGLQVPIAPTEKIVTESSNWAKEGDLTMMLIQDWGVIRLYQTFLNAWTKAFRNATAPGPGTCDSNRQPPGAKNVHKGSGPKGKRIPKGKKQNRPMRKHPVAAGQNSSSSQGPKRGIPRNRLLRNKQKKPVEM